MAQDPSQLELKAVRIAGQTQAVDLLVSNGVIADISPTGTKAATLILPLMADAHVHLDKTFTVHRTGGGATSLFDAIDRMETDKSNWTDEDLFARGTRALETAWLHGIGAMRTHVDWMTPEVPQAWRVLSALRDTWRGRVDLQLASLSPIDVLADAADEIAAQVSASDGVFGAFIYRNDDLLRKIEHVFAVSSKHDLPLDFHVDEGLEEAAQGFDIIIENAGRRNDAPSVLCGHACSLSVRPADDVKRVLGAAAKAQVGLIVLPTTNSYLQDNQPGRTPRLRGIAPMHEAAAAGMDVLIGSDNVRDVFYPYGDYDLFDVFRGCIGMAHLDPAAWLPAISQRAVKWCDSSAIGDIAVGNPAHFISFDATDLDDALSRPNAIKCVCRDGVFIQ
ncbi:MAG: amidohydrolase family protein [Roseobacter sp.]